MRATIRWALGLAALCAAARAAVILYQDNQLVKRTDLMREMFAEGQAAERARRTAQEATERMWAPAPMPDWLVPTAKEMAEKYPNLWAERYEFMERFGQDPAEGPRTLADGWRVVHSGTLGEKPMVTFLPPGMEEPDDFVERDLAESQEPEGIGWVEFGGPHEDPETSGSRPDEFGDDTWWHG